MDPVRKQENEPPVTRDGWISVAAAARSLGISYTTVCAHALKGDLQTHVFADRIFVHRDSVEQLRSKREASVEVASGV